MGPEAAENDHAAAVKTFADTCILMVADMEANLTDAERETYYGLRREGMPELDAIDLAMRWPPFGV